ncbi:MAG: SDR family oxidoreductase [Clostridium sp.]|nr:SDR family oxidoreductase [Clostridium sp.]
MLLENKKLVLMGVRNKWSIAWGAAKSAHDNGAQLICTYNPEEGSEKLAKLLEEFPGTKLYPCDAGSDDSIRECFAAIKADFGKVDGILHSIAHAFTDDLRNDFINTSREGYAHACDVSAYSLVKIVNEAVAQDALNEGASIVTYTYYGSEKAVVGYNVMGVAKAALEASIRYLAQKDFGSILDVIEEKAPMHKNVTIEQVGDTTTFLFSNMSSGITGEIIHCDNGFTTVGV